ncbi:MAG: hypothetical protein O2779_04340 [Nanoarchaeota archaeon]|nr:hypothetical protein [Nanoarchaeota archaeon]
MKITIDTQEDSHEDIEHALSLLRSLMGKKMYSNSPNIFESDDPVVGLAAEPTEAPSGNIFGSMFGDSSSSAPPAEPVETTLIEEDDDVESDESVEIIPY